MKVFLTFLWVTFVYAAGYLLVYFTFDSCLLDDVEFEHGRKRNKRWKYRKNFWDVFLFKDIKDEVIKWHYLFFYINSISYFTMMVLIEISIIL